MTMIRQIDASGHLPLGVRTERRKSSAENPGAPCRFPGYG